LRRTWLTYVPKHIERTDILDPMDEVTPSATNGACDEAAKRYQNVWK